MVEVCRFLMVSYFQTSCSCYRVDYILGRDIDPNNRILAQQISSKRSGGRATSHTSDQSTGGYCRDSEESEGATQ